VLALLKPPLRSEVHEISKKLNYTLKDKYLDTAAVLVPGAAQRVGWTRRVVGLAYELLRSSTGARKPTQ